MKAVLTSFALLFLTSTQLQAAFWRKKKQAQPTTKQQPRKKNTREQIALKIDDLIQAIKLKNWDQAHALADGILADNIEEQVITLAQHDFADFSKDIQKLLEDRKKAKKEAEEKELQARRKKQALEIKAKVYDANVLSADECGIVAEYAVD